MPFRQQNTHFHIASALRISRNLSLDDALSARRDYLRYRISHPRRRTQKAGDGETIRPHRPSGTIFSSAKLSVMYIFMHAPDARHCLRLARRKRPARDMRPLTIDDAGAPSFTFPGNAEMPPMRILMTAPIGCPGYAMARRVCNRQIMVKLMMRATRWQHRLAAAANMMIDGLWQDEDPRAEAAAGLLAAAYAGLQAAAPLRRAIMKLPYLSAQKEALSVSLCTHGCASHYEL